jgi:hypothetical protein
MGGKRTWRHHPAATRATRNNSRTVVFVRLVGYRSMFRRKLPWGAFCGLASHTIRGTYDKHTNRNAGKNNWEVARRLVIITVMAFSWIHHGFFDVERYVAAFPRATGTWGPRHTEIRPCSEKWNQFDVRRSRRLYSRTFPRLSSVSPTVSIRLRIT